MPKPCPECKSANTRQMDYTTRGHSAYCLSCYNVFPSIHKAVEVKSIKPRDRWTENITTRLREIEKELKEIKKEVLNGS
jgi:hypothetical protein